MPWRCGDACEYAAPFPSPLHLAGQFLVSALIIEVLFYHNHRLLHQPW
jgi:hypothetical protein